MPEENDGIAGGKAGHFLPATIKNLDPIDVFGSEEALIGVVGQIETAARSMVFDASTKQGRDGIASLAYRVARTKTFLDEKLGKPLVADWKERAAGVDRMRKLARDRLDALKEEVRAPLTAWEHAEADRQAAIQRRMDAMAAVPPETASAAELRAAFGALEAMAVSAEDFAERLAEAKQAKAATLYRLSVLVEAAERREREAAEAAAAAEWARAEREAAIAAEAAARATAEAEARAAAEAQRQEQARAAAERRAAEAEAAAARAAAEADAEAQRRADAAAAAERERIEAGQRKLAEQAQADRIASMRRAADRQHQAAINNEVLSGLCKLGLSESQAKLVIFAVVRGQVPRMRIEY